MVPLLWIPFLVYCLWVSLVSGTGLFRTFSLIAAGFVAWQLLEYCIHRYAFHTIPGEKTFPWMIDAISVKRSIDKIQRAFPALRPEHHILASNEAFQGPIRHCMINDMK